MDLDVTLNSPIDHFRMMLIHSKEIVELLSITGKQVILKRLDC